MNQQIRFIQICVVRLFTEKFDNWCPLSKAVNQLKYYQIVYEHRIVIGIYILNYIFPSNANTISHTAYHWMAMALPLAFLSEDQFTCSICLEVFNNPVSTPCGHSFCQACISSYWDGGGRGTFHEFYECPLCKESFRKRPELQINRTLKEITEQFKQLANTGVPIDERGGGGVDVQNSKKNHHRLALSPPQRLGEMPETIFAEMMARFQRLSTSGIPETSLSHLNDPHPESPSPVNAPMSFHAQNNEHHDPPPPYSLPRRCQTTFLRLH